MTEEESEGSYVEPKQRFSSSDVIAAAAELRFTSPTLVIQTTNTKSKTDWHTKDIKDIIQHFNSNIDNGLNETKIANLQATYGKNELMPATYKNWLLLYFLNYKLWLIIISMILSITAGIRFSDIFILIFGIILLLLIIISFYITFSNQKMQKSMNSLKIRDVLVLRDNTKQIIDAINLVPGDIIFIQSGMCIEADIRVIECSEHLEIDESSLNINDIANQIKHKNEKISHDNNVMNMLWNGCICINGECKGIVVAIGNNTLIGKNAKLATKSNIAPINPILSDLCKLIISVSICLLSIICFILMLLLNSKNGVSMVGILCFLFGLLIVLISLTLICILKRLRAKTIIQTLRNVNMFAKTRECIYKLGDIDIICIDKNLLGPNNNVNDLSQCIQQFDNMDIKIIIISCENTENMQSIAKQCGYLQENEDDFIIIHGNDIMNELDWNSIFRKKRIIFSSISGKQKVKIIKKMKHVCNNKFICMTADGSNDCVAAMKASDFGISLGKESKDIVKEMSDMIVMDDKLESIIKGIKISNQLFKQLKYQKI